MKRRPVIKVCGMRESQNILEVASLNPDMMGFIFYPKSKRFVGEEFYMPTIPVEIEKIGVFVDEEPEKIIYILETLGFKTVQLHGSESPETCLKLKQAGFKVIKAFGLDMNFNWDILETYTEVTDCFLFDTKTVLHGGSGRKFNWDILEAYSLQHPFLLSGGIKPEDLQTLKSFNHPENIGFDINSGFETAPAVKNINLLKTFVEKIK